jgi:hypothetical protein
VYERLLVSHYFAGAVVLPAVLIAERQPIANAGLSEQAPTAALSSASSISCAGASNSHPFAFSSCTETAEVMLNRGPVISCAIE